MLSHCLLDFAEKSPKMLLGFVIVTIFGFGESKGCSVINVSCADITTDNGFKFPYNCFQPGQNRSVGHEVEISDINGTMIAVGGPPFDYSSQVKSIDNNSITTTECQNLHERCIVRGEKNKEHCWNYVITERTTPKSPDPSPPPTPADHQPGGSLVKEQDGVGWIGWVIGGIVIIGIIGFGIWCSKKKATVRRRIRTSVNYVQMCPGLIPSQAGRERPEGTGQTHSAADQQACDDNYQNGQLESVRTDSIDPAPGGETPPSSGLDRTLSNGTIQEAENGDRSAPDVNGASNHRSMYRSRRDDPGGVNGNIRRDLHRIRGGRGGRARGDPGPEDEDGGQPLLENQRAANPHMTGEAGSVYELSSGTQQDRSTAPQDADVESTLDMKNTTTG